ncbi:MAG: type II toxin-antitoxin system VapC family toxin [Deltaproteobacteria bacterium]|nr:type II toxin-antitoxin system VapC family toxin [Deltaproteobacteria bacterium]
MILVDANVLMYAAGAAHSNKAPSVELVHRIAAGTVDAVVDTETLQEILHRYRAINRWEDGRQLYSLTRALFPRAVPITEATLDRARDLMERHAALSARDAVHAAVSIEIRASSICSYDRDFDMIPEIRRVEPGREGR